MAVGPGAGVHVHRFGSVADGSPAVGLHGWGGTHETFAPLVPHLPVHRGLVCPDLPGYGRSDEPAAWAWEAVARATHAALVEAGVREGAEVVGSCSGALLALEIGRLRPGFFGRLVLVDPFAWMPWYFRLFTWPLLGPVAYWTAFENPVGRWITNGALAQRRAAGTDMTGSFAEQRSGTTLAYLRMLRRLQGPAHFRGVAGDIVIVHGERTFSAVRAGLDAWRRALPVRVVVEAPGAGHLPIMEAPSLLSSLLWEETAGVRAGS
ncbi:MAG: alpha/beta fold hydrolase [Deltaproteobacteria bacterium]|nr:MAG: alpha/beta fold hydrolase [Deltaproteobacteria bacterium]